MSKVFPTGLASLTVALLLSIFSVPASAEIVLGQSSDFSSPNSSLPKDHLRGMNAYFDEVNRRGGIRGEKIRLVSLDDAYNPDKTVENVKKLIETHQAVALVGSRGTVNMLKIVPIIQAAGIAHVGNTSSAKALRDPFVPDVFHIRASGADEIEAAVNHAWTIGIKKIAMYTQDDASGTEATAGLTASLQKRGSKPAVIALSARNSTDIAKAVDAVVAAQPQALILAGLVQTNGAFIQALRAKGVNPMFFVLSVSSGLHDTLKKEAAGVIVTQVSPYPFTALGSPLVQEYQTLISKTDDKRFSYGSIDGFINARVIVRALEKTSGPITRAKVVSALQTFANEDLGGFAINYSPTSNLGSRYVSITMLRADG
ncbi:MAG: transporter permease, partial [Polaromonas sp.]|nr:transporter permease [Polaromonas sp.]